MTPAQPTVSFTGPPIPAMAAFNMAEELGKLPITPTQSKWWRELRANKPEVCAELRQILSTIPADQRRDYNTLAKIIGEVLDDRLSQLGENDRKDP